MTDHPGPPAAPLAWAAAAPRFLAVAAQLGLTLLVIRAYEIEESRYLLLLMCLVCGGFAVNAWLPPRWRLGFFCLLSLLGLGVFLGWPAAPLALAIGAGLIGLCHLPVPLYARAGLLVVAGVVLAASRVQFPLPFWPVVASLFMFRVIVYLHDLPSERPRPGPLVTFAYFFPLPNLCFPLFPVLDFRTFRETYRSEDDYATYQTGVEWIVRGLAHLLLYRFVRYHLMPEPHELAEVPQLALFLAANYALYLKVSGWFHLVTGVLHLFGFSLPRTHHNYFFAASFTDVWRRINIYWKDFMTKIFFLPAFFRLRRWGDGVALVASVMFVFLATWVLHSYQVFWLVNELSLTWRDALLWLTVGALAAANLAWELRRAGRPRGAGGLTLRQAAGRSVRVAGMFLLVSFFWAVWTVPEFLAGLRVLTLDPERTLRGALWLAAVLLGVVVAGTVGQLAWSRLAGLAALSPARSFGRSAAFQLAALGLLLALTMPAVSEALGETAEEMIANLRTESYTPAEAGRLARGYYEDLAVARPQATPLLGLLTGRERRPPGLTYMNISKQAVNPDDPDDPADPYLEREPIPGWSGEVAGSRLTINSLGMRDREGITRQKPTGARRVALVGSSIVMGYGVGDEEVFGRLVENALNAGAGEGAGRVEVLNFGAGMWFAIHRRVVIDRKVFAFEPDAIFYFAHQDELVMPPRHLAGLVARGKKLPYACLDEVVRRAQVAPGDPQGVIEAQLMPLGREIVGGLYRDLVRECRRRNVLPVWVYVPMPGVVEVRLRASEVIGLAREAGFAVVDLSDWARGRAPAEVKVGGTDHHANALGHRLIAERLLRELVARPELIPGRR